MNNKKEILNDLIEAIHKYYPITQGVPNEEYEGYRILQKIIDTKIDGFTSGKLPDDCYALITQIAECFNNCPVNVHWYTNFPSYSISVELANETMDHIKRTSSLNVKISLLTNYYTIFFEEMNVFNGFKERHDKNKPVLFRILSSKNLNVDTEKTFIAKVQNIITPLFPGYKYVNHDFLFKKKLPKGIPIGFLDPIPNYYPIYAFLFDNWANLLTTVIID
jgi:hypothetical protein